MIFNGFKIAAIPFITDAQCKCGHELKEVSNGLLGKALYCPKCESVYELVMRKIPAKNITGDFIMQCRRQTKKISNE